MTTVYFRMAVPLAYMAIIYGLSSIPDTQTDPANLAEQALQWTPPALQNLLHIPLYAGLTLTWFWALQQTKLTFQTTLAVAGALALVYGVSDELHQTTVPGRFGSITDLMLNALGVALVIGYLIRTKSPGLNKPQ